MIGQQRILLRALAQMVAEYELLAERIQTLQDAQNQLSIVQAERQELVGEANLLLDRLNEVRIADGDPTFTLSSLRAFLKERRGARGQ